jgi:hypothetical protein
MSDARQETNKLQMRKEQFAALPRFKQDCRIIKHYFSLISAAKDGFTLIKEHEEGGLKDTFVAEDLISNIADNIRRAQIEDLGFSIDCKAKELEDKKQADRQWYRRELMRLSLQDPEFAKMHKEEIDTLSTEDE